MLSTVLQQVRRSREPGSGHDRSPGSQGQREAGVRTQGADGQREEAGLRAALAPTGSRGGVAPGMQGGGHTCLTSSPQDTTGRPARDTRATGHGERKLCPAGGKAQICPGTTRRQKCLRRTRRGVLHPRQGQKMLLVCKEQALLLPPGSAQLGLRTPIDTRLVWRTGLAVSSASGLPGPDDSSPAPCQRSQHSRPMSRSPQAVSHSPGAHWLQPCCPPGLAYSSPGLRLNATSASYEAVLSSPNLSLLTGLGWMPPSGIARTLHGSPCVCCLPHWLGLLRRRACAFLSISRSLTHACRQQVLSGVWPHSHCSPNGASPHANTLHDGTSPNECTQIPPGYAFNPGHPTGRLQVSSPHADRAERDTRFRAGPRGPSATPPEVRGSLVTGAQSLQSE